LDEQATSGKKEEILKGMCISEVSDNPNLLPQ